LTTSFRNKEPQATQTRDAIQNPPKVEEGKFKYALQGIWDGGFLKTTKEKDREQTHSSPDQKGQRKEGAENNPGSLLIMSQMSRFRAQSGPSSKSFVALSTKLAAVMLLRYC